MKPNEITSPKRDCLERTYIWRVGIISTIGKAAAMQRSFFFALLERDIENDDTLKKKSGCRFVKKENGKAGKKCYNKRNKKSEERYDGAVL